MVDDDNEPGPENVLKSENVLVKVSCLPQRHSTSDFKILTLGVRVGTSLLGRCRSRWYPTSGSSTFHALTSSASCTS